MAKTASDSDDPEPIRGDRGATILGPRNVPVERENPDLLASPYTQFRHDPEPEISLCRRAQSSPERRLGA